MPTFVRDGRPHKHELERFANHCIGIFGDRWRWRLARQDSRNKYEQHGGSHGSHLAPLSAGWWPTWRHRNYSRTFEATRPLPIAINLQQVRFRGLDRVALHGDRECAGGFTELRR